MLRAEDELLQAEKSRRVAEDGNKEIERYLNYKLIIMKMGIKKIPVSPEIILNFFIKKGNQFLRVAKGIPPDSKFLRAHYNPNRDIFELLIESKEFEDNLLGTAIPDIEVEFEQLTGILIPWPVDIEAQLERTLNTLHEEINKEIESLRRALKLTNSKTESGGQWNS